MAKKTGNKTANSNKINKNNKSSTKKNTNDGLSTQAKSLIYFVSAIILFFITFINQDGIVWNSLHTFIWGIFGYCAIFPPILLIYLTITTAYEKPIITHNFIAACSLVLFTATTLTTFIEPNEKDYFENLNHLYILGTSYKGFGLFGGIIARLFFVIFGKFGAQLISIIITLVIIMLITGISVKNVMNAAKKPVEKAKEINKAYIEHRESVQKQKEIDKMNTLNLDVDFNDFEEKPLNEDEKINQKRNEFLKAYQNINNVEKTEKVSKIHYIDNENDATIRTFLNTNNEDLSSFQTIQTDPFNSNVFYDDDLKASENDLKEFQGDLNLNNNQSIYDILSNNNNKSSSNNQDNSNLSNNKIPDNNVQNIEDKEIKQQSPSKEIPIDIYTTPDISSTNESTEDKINHDIDSSSDETTLTNDFDNIEEEPIEEQKPVYQFPPVELLTPPKKSASDDNIMQELHQNGDKLIQTLTSFNVKAKIINICRGPSVTRYEIQPAPGVKISKITNLADDIALNLAAIGVRIEAPIPGKSAIGVEVPNNTISMVSMRELIDSDDFKNRKEKLTCVLGKDITGKIFTIDLSAMPHLLIAGTTGSGKSVCVNSILISILYKSTPDEVRLILIDPKMVEFSKYRNIPHLLIPVVSDPKKAAGALNWAVNEMLERYKIFSECGTRDISGYNKLVDDTLEFNKLYPDDDSKYDSEGNLRPTKRMEQIVIAIDELADLMMSAPKEVEDSIFRLAQMARAAGMHLVIATQRPSVDVITGVIKANIPSRIALKVSSPTDSRTILDTGGADKLIGKGDMLCMPVGASKPIRVQGGYASDKEIENITSFIKNQGKANYNEDVIEKIDQIAESALSSSDKKSNDDSNDIDNDPLLEDAIKCIVEIGEASVSLLQRKLKVGYARAGRLVDILESMGIVGPSEGSKKRKVLMTYQQWLERNNMISK